MGLTNIGTPQVGNRAIIQLAIQAGIVTLIQDLVRFGMDKRTLLVKVSEQLENTMLAMQGSPDHAVHPALDLTVIGEVLSLMAPGDIWGAINMDVLDALLTYLSADTGSPVALVRDLPQTVPVDGPASLTAERAGGDPTQVTLTFPESPDGWTDYDIYVDFRLTQQGNVTGNPPVSGVLTDTITVLDDGQSHSIRVVYVDPTAPQMSRFGVTATV